MEYCVQLPLFKKPLHAAGWIYRVPGQGPGTDAEPYLKHGREACTCLECFVPVAGATEVRCAPFPSGLEQSGN